MADLNVTVQNGGLSISIGGADQLEPLLAAAAASAALAASLNNRYQVSFSAPVIVDVAAGTVSYPRFIVGREGEAFKFVTPSDYSGVGDAFVMPLAAPSISEEHYVDLTMVAPAQTANSPVKTTTGGVFAAHTPTTVPLGISFGGTYQNLWGADVEYINNGIFEDTLVLQGGDPFYDEHDLWGGGPLSVYLPLGTNGGQIYNASSPETFSPIHNAECAERKGYCKVQFPDTGEVWGLVLNKDTGIVSTVIYTDLPNLHRSMLLGARWAGVASFFISVRNVTDNIGDNIFPGGKVMPPELLDVFDPGAPAAVTDSTLTALGFVSGIQGQINSRIVLGMGSLGVTSAATTKGANLFIRFAVQVSADNAFAANGLIFLWDTSNNLLATVSVPMERQLSARAAMYSAAVPITAEGFAKFYAGVDMTGTSASAIITGMQFAVSHDRVLGIHPADYPEYVGAFDAGYPPFMFVNKGRPLPFYPAQILKAKRNPQQFNAALWASNVDSGAYAFEREGSSQLLVDALYIDDGNGGGIDFRLPSNPDRLYRIPFNFRVGPAAGGGAVRKLHCIGDSIMNREQPMRTAQILEATGYSVTCIGTMQNMGGGTNAAPAFGGEGRESRQFADYIYEYTDAVSPVAVGSEADYRARDDTAKLTLNPYLRAATSSDDAQYVHNGYTFDFRFYLDRFSFDDPTHVIIDLGRNDISLEDPATSMTQIEHGYRVMRDRIRAACPDAYIVFGMYSDILSSGAITDWETDKWNILLRLMDLIQADVAAGDTRLFFLPTYAHVTQSIGFNLTQISADSSSRLTTYTFADYIHPDGPLRQQVAEVNAAFVGACPP